MDRRNGTASAPTGSTSTDGTGSRPPAEPSSAPSRGSAASPGPTPPSPSHEGNPVGAADDAVAIQVERVETLLAAVRDIVSSLGATSAQLEREVAQALRPAPAGPAQASASRAKSEHASPSPPQDALEAERAALLEAVEHRAVIEQAKGMLMLKHRCEADDAFGLLLEISRRERRKVREIAADLVRAGSRSRPLVDLTTQHDRPALR